MRNKPRVFGRTREGALVHSFTLYGADGSLVTLLEYGAALQQWVVPDRQGMLHDIVLGFDDLNGYEQADNPYFGATVGRSANRIGGAAFDLDGDRFQLAANDRGNHLHGGLKGFDRQVWQGSFVTAEEGSAVQFYYRSPDGEEGYPGNLDVTVTYVLTRQNALIIRYEAVCDRKTVINLTNHSYFNLSGQGSGSVMSHRLKLNASEIAAIDARGLPDGTRLAVEGTALDFRSEHALGERISDDHEQMNFAHGYDHPYLLDGADGSLRACAWLKDDRSGRVLELATTMPCVQLYTCNFLKPMDGKEGARYDRRNAVCLEAQMVPNAVNLDAFAKPVFAAGECYRQETVYRLRTDG